MQQESMRTYGRLAGLILDVERYFTERHELDVSSGFRRVTTEVVLVGGGIEGRGEDVTYTAAHHDEYPDALPLSGEWTLEAFSQQLAGLDLFPGITPERDSFRYHRRWAFESAALDLALRQAKVTLGQALGRDYAPVRFVLSTRLDIKPWLAVNPELEFKLDPTPEWNDELMSEIAATGRVRTLDFKAFYEGSSVDNPPDAEQYRLVSRAFPEAVLEDPAVDGPARAALRGEEERFSFDAPIHSWANVEAVAARVAAGGPGDGFRLRYLNIKPSRFGSVRALLECIDRATQAGMTVYGGGQFELGVGRDHIEALASLFYPDAPNDVAPREYHGAAHGDVPPSPLVPFAVQSPGFGFAFNR